jgi:glycosyltransferase involved in cell wall biosynthesis
MRDPQVSVLMPVYDGERFLAEAVESILGQSFGDFEFLIFDDGSTDGSLEILAAYARRDPRIRLELRAHRGLIATLNEGIELARAGLIARMDADDVALPGRLARQVDYMRDHPECVALGSCVLIVDPQGRPICEFGRATAHAEIDAAHLSGLGGMLAHPAAMLRRSALMALGGYRSGFDHAEDRDLFLRLAELGCLANLPEVLLHYRVHLGSVGHTSLGEQRRAARRAIADARRRRGLEPEGPHDGTLREGRSERSIDVYRKWGWWALAAGNVATARWYACASLLRSPLSPRAWRLAACAMRGW